MTGDRAGRGRRIAVVIGVRESGVLPPLPGAPKGAEAFAEWADETCDEVHRFIDKDGPVRRAEVYATIKSLTDGTVSQLLIYYSGHGLASSIDQDYWFLSGAAADTSEIVDVRTSLDNARAYSRIQHVVMFADACRTIAGKGYAQSTKGASPIFPAPLGRAINVGTVIDVFYATKTGEVALERAPTYMTADDVERAIVGAHGFFTDALLPALRGEVPKHLRPNPQTGATVLYAQHLAAYLSERVPLMTGEAVLLSQEADPRPASSHPLFVTEIRQPQSATLTIEARLPNGSLANKARVSILDLTNPLEPVDLEVSVGGRISRELPQNTYYGAKAFLADHHQAPKSPNPVTFLFADLPPVTVDLVPTVRSPAIFANLEQPSLVETFIVDAIGKAHTTSPDNGIFSVVSRDLLSGRTANEVQVLMAGARPSLNRPLEADSTTENRLDRDVELHAVSHALCPQAAIGLAVAGANIVEAVTKDNRRDLLSEEYDDGSCWFIRGYAPGSAIVVLAAERYACAALLPGFVGSLIVGPAGVRSLSYAPSANSDFYVAEEEAQLLRTRVLAQAAVGSGRFDMVVDFDRPIADKLCAYRRADPVLGVLAAYAYHQTGDERKIRDMIDCFHDAGQFVPFDLLMLGRVEPELVDYRFAPGFPLLSQGWRLLGDDDSLQPTLAKARLHLAPSLWTTLVGPAGRDLADAVRRGDIQ